ncbi:unnamed protein product [Caenorhabditis bovis]|uniref:Peptidase M13 N-terminal domain-containing protein n=1 Tax=Caenorhabditis bovis TaxID=2654633 RepID=A0A8S1F4T8_9PELO|nr:unnamed protein product [Caenorhabditis bovis]
MYQILLFLASIHIIPFTHSKPYSVDFIVAHLNKYANESINPCDDFYAHVCPPEGINFMRNLYEELTDDDEQTQLDFMSSNDLVIFFHKFSLRNWSRGDLRGNYS